MSPWVGGKADGLTRIETENWKRNVDESLRGTKHAH